MLTIGVDIGGTNIKIGLVHDGKYSVLYIIDRANTSMSRAKYKNTENTIAYDRKIVEEKLVIYETS